MGDFSGKVQPLTSEEEVKLKQAEHIFFSLKNPTWGDFSKVINTNPVCTRDEGGMGMYGFYNPKDKSINYHSKDKVLTKNTDAISAFWVQGGSEGYYLHVNGVLSGKNIKFAKLGKPQMSGKFWGRDTAEACGNYIQRLADRRWGSF